MKVQLLGGPAKAHGAFSSFLTLRWRNVAFPIIALLCREKGMAFFMNEAVLLVCIYGKKLYHSTAHVSNTSFSSSVVTKNENVLGISGIYHFSVPDIGILSAVKKSTFSYLIVQSVHPLSFENYRLPILTQLFISNQLYTTTENHFHDISIWELCNDLTQQAT